MQIIPRHGTIFDQIDPIMNGNNLKLAELNIEL